MAASDEYYRSYNPALIDKLLEESPDNPRRKITPTPNESYSEDAASSDEIIMVVDLGDGRKKNIRIVPNDDALALAKRFCFENNIDGKVIPLLTKNIKSFMVASFSSERENAGPVQHNNPNTSRLSDRQSEGQERRPTPQSRQKSNNKVNTSTSSVFDRLYNSSMMRDEPSKPQSMNRDKQNKNPNVSHSLVNNGVMIYQRNTRLSEQNKRKIQKRIEQLKVAQETSLTFHPEINPISKLMVERIRQLSPEETIQQKNSRVKREKIIQYRMDREKQENSLCTFHPQTNRAHSNSMYVSQQHSRSTDRFKQLYADSTTRANRKEKLREQHCQSHSFKPKINRVSEYIVNGIKFEERLKKYSFEKLAKEQKVKRLKDESAVYDGSGNPRFHPQTGRAPSTRNRDGLPIGHYLYNNRFSKDRAIMRLKEEEDAKRQQACANDQSSKIYAQTKLNSLLELFSALDDDGDGVICSRKINISEVNPRVLQILSPLLNEMEELDAQLTEQEFVQAVERLLKTLSVADRNVVLRHNKNKRNQLEASTFQPSLNERSLEIASSIRPSNSRTPGVSLYEYCEERKLDKETSLSRLRSQKQQDELKQCTFQPRVTPLRKRSTTFVEKNK